jgi:hypothetical protein
MAAAGSGSVPRVGDDWRAYLIDSAVWEFGSAVEADMDLAERSLGPKAKPERIARARQAKLDQYLTEPAREEAPKGRFRDPASIVKTRKR